MNKLIMSGILVLTGLLMIHLMVSTYDPIMLNKTGQIGIKVSNLPPPLRTLPQYDAYDHHVTHKGLMTSAVNSVFYVQNLNDIIPGETVEVLLEAFDIEGHPRTTGGDFWVALMHSETFNYSTSGTIFDNNNGSYSIFFYVAITGRFTINITLVHPVESLNWLRDVYIPDERVFTLNGKFISNNQTFIEQCQVRHIPDGYQFDKEQFCYYGYGPDGLGHHTAFVCGHPPDKINCDVLEYLKAHGGLRALDKPVDLLLTGKEYLFKEPNYMAEMSPKYVLVHSRCGNETQRRHQTEAIPIISSKDEPNTSNGANRIRNVSKWNEPNSRNLLPEESAKRIPAGYWLNNQWHSLKTNITIWTSEMINECLAGYDVIMLGDSTMVQWINALDTRINWEYVKRGSFLHIRQTSGFNLTFHRNRLPKDLSSRGAPFKGQMEHFEPELINRLPTNGRNYKYVVLIGLAAHYATWPLVDYADRLRTIKSAVQKLRQKCNGNVVVVIKKAQARDHPTFGARVHSNNWVFHAMNKIMEEVFGDIDAIFVDIWDMVLSFPSKLDMHMPLDCIQNEVDLFLTQVCAIM